MMNVVLLDTNIISYQHNEHSLWDAYEPRLKGKVLLTAAQSVAELRYGAFRRDWGTARQERLEHFIRMYTVIYPNNAICTMWARTRASVEKIGRPLENNDTWIAATALTLGIPLVTHNKKHFDFLEGLTLISEISD
jgi:tRNA(fMet)-specific endonuclease VapC